MRNREHPSVSARSKTPSMHGNFTRENREVPSTPDMQLWAGRLEKDMIQKSNMYVDGKSDGRAVPTKCLNKSGNPLTEGMEGRRPAEENTEQTTASQTQSWGDALSGLRGVREAAKRDKRLRFTALLHHVSVLLLESSFYALKRDAAPGVDGVTWMEYETGLSERLKDLHSRVHRGTYRAQPSKRAYIPKADGRKRPLGIAALEDKIVQHAVVTVLNQIYEEDFLGFSYGFRPGRRPHDALDALWVGIMRRKVNWILDADIRSFFDEIRHDWLLKFVKHRIADRRILRLIGKWLRAGVSEEGQWSKTERGTPQGSVASPLLANVYLHYAFDLWVQHWRQHRATGEVIVVRYADDAVLGFQHRADAEQFLRDWKERSEPVRTRAAPGQDTIDRVRALRSRKPKRAWRREAGDVQLPGVHPHLWANLEDRQIPCSTQDHPPATLCQIESAEGGASKTQTSVRGGAREMVEVRSTGILQLSCRPRESGQPSKFSVTGDSALVARATAPQPEESDDLATTRGDRRTLAPPT